MVLLVNGNIRNKTEELLQAEKIISDLKYIQACTTLIAYANTLRNFAGMIAESEGQAAKLQELMIYIYSIIYASKFLGLFSLNEFRDLMMNFFGTDAVPVSVDMVDPKIEQAFRVKQTPYEINTYFLEMGGRNKISLEKINEIHQFSNNPVFNNEPPIPPMNPINNVTDLNAYQNNPYNNPVDNRQTYPEQSKFFNDPFAPAPVNNNPFNPGNNPYQNAPNPNPVSMAKPSHNDFFVPPVNPSPPAFNPMSQAPKLNDINKIEDIPLYPDMDMEFKNMNQPTAMRTTNNPIQPAIPTTPSVVWPAIVPVVPDVPLKNPVPPPVALVDNPFPEPSKEFFVPPVASQAQWNNPTNPTNPTNIYPANNGNTWNNPTTIVDQSFEQICEQIRKGL
jgi:hypothetical protein